MNRRTTVQILWVCAFALLAPPPTFADYVGLEIVDRNDLEICKDQSETYIPYKMDVCDVHAVFDASSDRLISVAFTNVSTTAPQGFFQHPLGVNTAPPCAFIPLFPTLVCDSFVTLGVECDGDGNATDPDFDSTKFNSTGEVSGGWFNSNPIGGQGVPDANGRVMIARFSYKQNKNTSGDVCVFTKLAGSKDISAFLLQPFDCAVPGGGLGPTCGDAGTGSCFEDNGGTPFCNCAACCDLVCMTEPFCCGEDEGYWDAGCEQTACAVCDFTSCEDCNSNTTPDECVIDAGSQAPGGPFFCNPLMQTCADDCNDNGVPDQCDIAGGNSTDVDDNGVPDECQEDCNFNGVFDLIDIANQTSEDCNENSVPDECEIVLRGPIFLSGHDADDNDAAGPHCCCEENACGNLYPQLLSIAVDDSQIDSGVPPQLLAIGLNGDPFSQAAVGLEWFNDPDNGGPNADVTFATDITEIQTIDFANFSAIYIPSVDDHTFGGITDAQLAALNTRQADIENFVGVLNGGLLALTQADAPGAYGWLPVPLITQTQQHTSACPTEKLNLILDGPVDCTDLSPPGPYHSIFTGPSGFLGLSVLAVSDSAPAGEVLILGEVSSRLGVDCNGDGTPDSCQCPWDSDGDGNVGAFDLAVLLGNWGPLGVGNPARCLDADGDGEIGPFDLAHLLGNWGPCPPP